jgi:hypothetical protein
MFAGDAAEFGNLPLWVFNPFLPFARLRSRGKLPLRDNMGRHGEASLSLNDTTAELTCLAHRRARVASLASAS